MEKVRAEADQGLDIPKVIPSTIANHLPIQTDLHQSMIRFADYAIVLGLSGVTNRCSTVRGCPARKHVERATDDPTMLMVTYEGEHRHTMQEISAPA
ncbi:hypothetical protein SASPL_155857 [Salvia splendens]|uniref:WRKY domain-containing protein n=1 Tax=Salvia splendens TaxID=180675 RepID=A0A8X8VXR5_SALSN|nr:hypothetical protein SASPL_155857 [Salvia splendens]